MNRGSQKSAQHPKGALRGLCAKAFAKKTRDVRSFFRPRTLQSIAFATKCLVKPLRSFAVYRPARIGYALRDIFAT